MGRETRERWEAKSSRVSLCSCPGSVDDFFVRAVVCAGRRVERAHIPSPPLFPTHPARTPSSQPSVSVLLKTVDVISEAPLDRGTTSRRSSGDRDPIS